MSEQELKTQNETILLLTKKEQLLKRNMRSYKEGMQTKLNSLREALQEKEEELRAVSEAHESLQRTMVRGNGDPQALQRELVAARRDVERAVLRQRLLQRRVCDKLWKISLGRVFFRAFMVWAGNCPRNVLGRTLIDAQ